MVTHHGRVPREEMYQVFNMGIGMVAIVSQRNAQATLPVRFAVART